ncbi:MAG: sugar phosphate isomerase/epimerase [Blastochloris sp.]|jgi:sugar phosphate isomerase/epimerase|nr:sugar phosphate isomerase/epimerase [Blastochloris sp.]
MKINQIAAQLYTCRDLLKTPTEIAQTLKRLRKIGYTAVQVSGMGPIPENELNIILNAEGLTCCATHEPSDLIRQNPQAVVDRLKLLNCKLTAYPFPSNVDMSNRASLDSLCFDLNQAGKLLAESGQILTYHNHGNEFIKTDGVTALDYIYQNTDPNYLQAEPDTYWIQYGGGNNIEWCEKLKNRLPMIHLKDYSFTAANTPIYCEIGQGTLNFKAIISAAEKSGCQWFIVEQDTCPQDPVESLQISFEYIQEHLVS